MTPAYLKSAVRLALGIFIGILVSKGRIEAPNAEQLESVAGAVAAALTAVSMVWSWFHHKKVEKAIETALEMPKGTSKEQLREKLDRT